MKSRFILQRHTTNFIYGTIREKKTICITFFNLFFSHPISLSLPSFVTFLSFLSNVSSHFVVDPLLDLPRIVPLFSPSTDVVDAVLVPFISLF